MNLKDKKKYWKPIGSPLEDPGYYYIVKFLIDVPPAHYVNTSTSTDMISVDLNANHIGAEMPTTFVNVWMSLTFGLTWRINPVDRRRK